MAKQAQGKRERRQYVRFAFHHVDLAWRRLEPAERAAMRRQFEQLIDSWAERILLRTYSTLGTRSDCDFLLWSVSEDLDDLQEFASDVVSSGLGAHLETPYSYLSMTKHSTYVREHLHPGQHGSRLTIAPGDAKYLFVYPFVKTRGWYRLAYEERQRIMHVHITVGHKYPTVVIHTTYSFGLDDQEFVLAFETDYPADFLDLVQELRETESSSYTLRDTPIFTCVSMPIRDILDSLKREAEEQEAEQIAEASAGTEDVALIAADELASLLETIHLLRSPTNAARLLTALERALQDTVEPQTIDELRVQLGLPAGG